MSKYLDSSKCNWQFKFENNFNVYDENREIKNFIQKNVLKLIKF